MNEEQELTGFTTGLPESVGQPLDISMVETPFSEMNALRVIQTPTNPEWIKMKNNLSYISGDTVTRLLNKAFLYRWSFEVVETRVVQSQAKKNETSTQGSVVQVHGRLTVPGWGVREQWGSQPLVGGSDVQEHAFKSAATDAMKKCASLFGIALDLYGKENFDELLVSPIDYLTDDVVFLEKLKQKQIKAREEKLKEKAELLAQQEMPAEAPQEVLVAPEPVVETAPPIIHQTQPVNSPAETPVTSEPQPAPVETPAVASSHWAPEDIEGLIAVKARLGITSNEGLDVYAQEFFAIPEATFRHIAPINVKDFLHFMDSKQ